MAVTMVEMKDAMRVPWRAHCHKSESAIGSAIGSVVAGPLSDSIGRWRSCQIQAVLFTLGSLLIGNSTSSAFLVAGRIINGMGIAFAFISSLPYLNEISPLKYRGRFQGSFELFIVFGILISTLLNYLADDDTHIEWTWVPWRWTHIFPVFFAAAQAVFLFALPESPQFLVQKGLDDAAIDALEHMYADPEVVRNELNRLKLTNMNKSSGVFKTFFFALQKYSDAMYVVIGITILQCIAGGYVWESYAPLIYEKVNFTRPLAMKFTFLLGVIRFVTTLLIMFVIDSKRAGRKQLLTYGILAMFIGNILFPLSSQSGNAAFIIIASALIVIGSAIGFGIVIHLLQSEMFPVLIRSRSIAISMLIQSSLQAIILLIFGRAQENQFGSRIETIFWVFAAGTFLSFIYVRMFIPETLRRTPDEILSVVACNLEKQQWLEFRSFYHNEALDAPSGDSNSQGSGSHSPAGDNNRTNRTPQAFEGNRGDRSRREQEEPNPNRRNPYNVSSLSTNSSETNSFDGSYENMSGVLNSSQFHRPTFEISNTSYIQKRVIYDDEMVQ